VKIITPFQELRMSKINSSNRSAQYRADDARFNGTTGGFKKGVQNGPEASTARGRRRKAKLAKAA